MKLYNPFKPHIVRFTGWGYGIRRLEWRGWRYLDGHRYCWRRYNFDECRMSGHYASKVMQNINYKNIAQDDECIAVNVREVSIFTLCGYILAYGLATSAGVLIAWPIIEWAFTKR